MKKESILAISLGVVLGIGVGMVILRGTNKTDNKAIARNNANQAQARANRPAEKAVSFEISAPSNDTSVTSKTVDLKGKASKESLLVIQSPSVNKIVKLEADTFSIPVNLALGENVFNITYYPKEASNDYQERELRIFYLPE